MNNDNKKSFDIEAKLSQKLQSLWMLNCAFLARAIEIAETVIDL